MRCVFVFVVDGALVREIGKSKKECFCSFVFWVHIVDGVLVREIGEVKNGTFLQLFSAFLCLFRRSVLGVDLFRIRLY